MSEEILTYTYWQTLHDPEHVLRSSPNILITFCLKEGDNFFWKSGISKIM